MSSDSEIRVGVLASGRGSNFEALLRKQTEGYFRRAQIVCLFSNKSSAPALEIARIARLPTATVSPLDYDTLSAYECELIRHCDEQQVQWLALAGYMKIMGPDLLGRFRGRIINIHPSLLPAFPGLHSQKQALQYGVKVAGCTAHFVDEGVDTGPIITQKAVNVLRHDTEEILSDRILQQEHQLFPEALKMVTERPWAIEGRIVRFLD